MSAFLRRSGQNPHRWATKGMKSKKELLAIKKHIKRKSAKAKHNRLLGIHNPHAAGADIGATEIYIAVPPDRLEMNVRCFGTFTQDLRAIVQWLRECKVTSGAMESTGVYSHAQACPKSRLRVESKLRLGPPSSPSCWPLTTSARIWSLVTCNSLYELSLRAIHSKS